MTTMSNYDRGSSLRRRKGTAQTQEEKTKASCSSKGANAAAILFLGIGVVCTIFHSNNADLPRSSINNVSRFFKRSEDVNRTLGDGPMSRPKDWHLWGYDEFLDEFNCNEHLNDYTKPLPTMEDWETMLEAYNKVVDPTYKFDDEIPPTQGYRLNKDGAPPYYAKLSPGKGRGLFATRDIQKGEIVHDGSKSDVVFPNETAWRRFMFVLPRKMACDTAEWTFTQQFNEKDPPRVVSSLNIAILMNEGNAVDEVNVQPQNESGEPSGFSTLFRAMRDVKKDEEILMNYDDYTTDYAAAGIAELYLSSLSCTSFETCSMKELYYLIRYRWLFKMENHNFMIRLIASSVACLTVMICIYVRIL